MSVPLIIIMAVLQFYVSAEQILKGNVAVGCMFLGYGFSNIFYVFIVK